MMSPLQALENLNKIAENALLNGPDRRIITQSLNVLHALIQKCEAELPKGAPGGVGDGP